MTVYRSMGRGTWIVEASGVRRATGTHDRDLAAEIETMLSKLADARPDLIEAVNRKAIGLLDLYQAFLRHGTSLKLTVERAIELWPAIDRWLKVAEVAPTTALTYRYALRKVTRRRGALADLPDLLARYKKRARGRMFNLARSAAQAFVRDTVTDGRYSDLWRRVSAIRTKPVQRHVTHGLPVKAARLVAEQLGRLGPMWWTLCCTGMGRKDYWRSRWQVEATHIVIHGTKTEYRERVVPRLCDPVRPMCGEQGFAKSLKAVGNTLGIQRLTIYVARRTFAHWIELARIPPSRQDAYMGHAPKGVSGGYREHDVGPYLGEDRRALLDFIGRGPAYLRAMA